MSLTTIVLLGLTLLGGPWQTVDVPAQPISSAPGLGADWYDCGEDADCEEGQFCRFPRGACGGDGTCTAIPDLCSTQYDPVCGCDEETYSNTCEAFSYSMSIDYGGSC